jgi:hypothetical protein
MSEQRNDGEFHRADPAYRRQMQGVLAVTVVLGLLALVGLHFLLANMGLRVAHGDLFGYEKWLNRLLGGLCLLLGAAAAAFALWLFRMAKATKGERRWPPTSMRTSADVRIRYLTSADSLVTQLKAGAFGLTLLAVALVSWAAWLFWPHAH